MKSNLLKIANAQGFWGDQSYAAKELIEKQPDLNYITFDYLSEVSLSIMAIQREKDLSLGYAEDFIDVIKDLSAYWKSGSKVKIIANAGGLNPKGCAEKCKRVLEELNCSHMKIAIVTGDDVLTLLKNDPDNKDYKNLDSSLPLSHIIDELNTANAYLGAASIVEALLKGADIVITGRIADPSLTVAPCVVHFGWNFNDFDKIAQATVAGHLIECGTQVTGGICQDWLNIEGLDQIGFPFIEMQSDGDFVITKPENTGGKVSEEIVKEQLLYEIGDPENYMSPDVIVSITSLKLEEIGKNRVKVTGAKGKSPPQKYKVSATYKDGYRTEGSLVIFGRNCKEKALKTADVLFKRMERLGFSPERKHVECIGCGDIVPGINIEQECSKKDFSQIECLLRIAIADHSKKVLDCFSRQIAPMVTSGPPGTTGYTSGRPHIRQVFGFWPCLIERNKVAPKVEILSDE